MGECWTLRHEILSLMSHAACVGLRPHTVLLCFPPQYDEHVISPKEFVHLAGKSTLKDWKRAIRMNGIMLRWVPGQGAARTPRAKGFGLIPGAWVCLRGTGPPQPPAVSHCSSPQCSLLLLLLVVWDSTPHPMSL